MTAVPVTHQNARLSAGRHNHPHDGVCALELASLLAGEPFSDRPRSVCPVIAAFISRYNDGIDDDRRQDLYAVASALVGTAAGPLTRHRRTRLISRRAQTLAGNSARTQLGLRLMYGDGIGAECANQFLRSGDHDGALRFIDELLELDDRNRALHPDPAMLHGKATSDVESR